MKRTQRAERYSRGRFRKKNQELEKNNKSKLLQYLLRKCFLGFVSDLLLSLCLDMGPSLYPSRLAFTRSNTGKTFSRSPLSSWWSEGTISTLHNRRPTEGWDCSWGSREAWECNLNLFV